MDPKMGRLSWMIFVRPQESLKVEEGNGKGKTEETVTTEDWQKR